MTAGYYARYAALRSLLLRFLAGAGSVAGGAQVLALGAGYDTSFFQLALEGIAPAKYVELDFAQASFG